MRRVVIALGIVLALVGGASCTGADTEAGTETGEASRSDQSIDVAAAEERYAQVCGRTVTADRYSDCVAAVGAAVDQATDAGCSTSALEAWAEHGVAWLFTVAPAAGFFDRCPVPLSNLVLPSVPEPYRPAVSRRGLGLLDTAATAEGFAAPHEVEAYLGRLDHQVSYAAAWAAGDDVVLVRLDRFATPEQAGAFLDSDHRPAGAGEGDGPAVTPVPGIVQGRVQEMSGSHLATGRVCEVVMTLHAQGSADGGIEADVVLDWFRAQARRIQTAVTC